MKPNVKKAVAMVLSFAMVLSLALAGSTTIVKADNERTITLSTEGSNIGSTVYYRTDSGTGWGAWNDWTADVTIAENEKIEVKVVPEAECELDSNTTLKKDGNHVQGMNWETLLADPNTSKESLGPGVELITEEAGGYRLEIKLNNKQGGGGGPQGPGGDEEPHGYAQIDILFNGKAINNVRGFDDIVGDYEITEDPVIEILGYRYYENEEDENPSISQTFDDANTRLSTAKKVDIGGGNVVSCLEYRSLNQTPNSVTFSLETHDDHPDFARSGIQRGFYIFNITVSNNKSRVLQYDRGDLPDLFSDVSDAKYLDISTTTEASPAVLETFYASNEIRLFSDREGFDVTKIELEGGINPKAVEIRADGTVKFNSPYYSSIPFAVTLKDGTVGHIRIDRRGVDCPVVTVNTPDKKPIHGATGIGASLNGVAETDEYNIVCAFFYNAANSYKDYKIVANITFSDGTTENKVVEGYGETSCNNPSFKGGDYLVWSGKANNKPASVSVTAIKSDAVNSADSFGGASFGYGKGITFSGFGGM